MDCLCAAGDSFFGDLVSVGLAPSGWGATGIFNLLSLGLSVEGGGVEVDDIFLSTVTEFAVGKGFGLTAIAPG